MLERELDMNKVSVIVATYQRDTELIRALESVAGQTYTNLDVILADSNGNADWSKKYCLAKGLWTRSVSEGVMYAQ